ncbi:MAG: hypothetical protein RBT87_06380 [bacterium]|nr:hypothetical protein [bacterium]
MRNVLIPTMFLMVLMVSFNIFADCTKDTDCKGKRICVKGECVFDDEHQNELAPDEQTNWDIEELKEKRAEHKKKMKGAQVGMAIAFPIGAIFLVGGGVILGVIGEPITGSILLVGGGLEIILGFVSIGLYSHHKSKYEEYTDRLKFKKGVTLFENKTLAIDLPQPILSHSKNGTYYGVSFGFSL